MRGYNNSLDEDPSHKAANATRALPSQQTKTDLQGASARTSARFELQALRAVSKTTRACEAHEHTTRHNKSLGKVGASARTLASRVAHTIPPCISGSPLYIP